VIGCSDPDYPEYCNTGIKRRDIAVTFYIYICGAGGRTGGGHISRDTVQVCSAPRLYSVYACVLASARHYLNAEARFLAGKNSRASSLGLLFSPPLSLSLSICLFSRRVCAPLLIVAYERAAVADVLKMGIRSIRCIGDALRLTHLRENGHARSRHPPCTNMRVPLSLSLSLPLHSSVCLFLRRVLTQERSLPHRYGDFMNNSRAHPRRAVTR